MGLALQRSLAHSGASYLSCFTHVYLYHLRGSVIGSGQAPEALHYWLYCSCHSAPSLANLHWVSCWQALLDCHSSSLFWAASSSHSCHAMQSRVAWVATFSLSHSVSLIWTLHICMVSLVMLFLLGCLEAALA